MLLLIKSSPGQSIDGPILIIFDLLVSRVIRDSWPLNQRSDRDSFLLFAKALNTLLHVQSVLGAHVASTVFVKVVIETTLLLLT